jgi:peptide/nickel transport system permease protein
VKLIAYLARRLGSLVLVLLGMSMIVFLLLRSLPGDPGVMAAGGADATPEAIAKVREEMGLDRPRVVQYGLFVRNLLRGDLGRSIVTRREVLDDMKAFLPATVELALVSVFLACLLGIPMGVLSAVYRGRWPDALFKPFSVFAASMPVYWLGLMAVLVFYGLLGWLPAGGRLSSGTVMSAEVTGVYTVDAVLAGRPDLLWDALRHLVMPAAVLSGISLGNIANLTRATMLETLAEPFIVTARAKGLPEAAVVVRHAFGNITMPLVTVVGIQLGQLMGGVVLTETIFSWPGLGLYAVSALDNFDYPILMIFTLVYSCLYAGINILVDLLCEFLNPHLSV